MYSLFSIRQYTFFRLIRGIDEAYIQFGKYKTKLDRIYIEFDNK